MFEKDSDNIIFQLAADMVIHTNQHVFLTGKAGTGKTTFLKYIKETSAKNTVVVAPTGVAAINAGGVTMHSLFQLPRGVFLPGIVPGSARHGFIEINDRHSLFKNIHFNSSKRQLLEEMELLIIDEVSMIRCDMLDAIDVILRHFRKAQHLPFGGVQVIYIGDLFQLPPVVTNEEWNVMKPFYEGPFFFSAKVLSEALPLYLELKKIYRQSDAEFIRALNSIRNNTATAADLDFLNSRYDPDFTGSENEKYITITTHNKRADSINSLELNNLPGKLFSFKAVIKDDFSDKAMPTDMELHLKEGAQVMFIKNDSGEERRYFNGKLALIKKLTAEEIVVTFDSGKELILEKEIWKNIRYTYSKETNEIDIEELGTFTQYPIRLAWAITIHKSQGLTFEKAIIDAGSSFAPGQVYVALSRCTSIDGIVLRSLISPSAILTDQRILHFSKSEINDYDLLKEKLESEKHVQWSANLLKVFDWSKMAKAVTLWLEIELKKNKAGGKDTAGSVRRILSEVHQQTRLTNKFKIELNRILGETQKTQNSERLEERMKKAIQFFASELTKTVLNPLQEYIISIQHRSRVGKYAEQLKNIELSVLKHRENLLQSSWGDLQFADFALNKRFHQDNQLTNSISQMKKLSHEMTWNLYTSGKNLDEIASIRNLALGTIEGHIVKLVVSGHINALDLIAKEKIKLITQEIHQAGPSLSSIKEKLGSKINFYEIRIALGYLKFMQQEKIPV